MSEGVGSIWRPAGPVAAVIAEMAWVLIIGGALVFAVVIGLLAWVLLRRRAGRAVATGRADRYWVVGGGLLFPGVVLTALLVYAAYRTAELTPARQAGELVISVTARMWWWEVRYQDMAQGIDIVLANEIHLPAGRTVTLGLTSADVIHSFWVPALAGKVDMVPGRVHQLRLQAQGPGVWRGQCAEFCGLQHARMALHVVAHQPADFERWLVAQGRPAAPPADPLARRGLQVFEAQRCGACHAVQGLTSSAPSAPGTAIGPDLTHVGGRRYLGAGTVPTSRATLASWVSHSGQFKPGVRMPAYDRLDDPSLQALAAFLEQLQ